MPLIVNLRHLEEDNAVCAANCRWMNWTWIRVTQ